MENIIEQLLSSGIRDDIINPYKTLRNELAKMEMEFEKTLNDKEKQFFHDFSEAQFNFNAQHELEIFKYGFKLGFSLVIEALK